MTVPTTNVGFSSLQTEFGGSNPIGLSEYYRGGTYVRNNTTAPNGPIPTAGQISVGVFRGATQGVVGASTYTVTCNTTSVAFRGSLTLTVTTNTNVSQATVVRINFTSTIAGIPSSFTEITVNSGTSSTSMTFPLTAATGTSGSITFTSSSRVSGDSVTQSGGLPSAVNMAAYAGPTSVSVSLSPSTAKLGSSLTISASLNAVADKTYTVSINLTAPSGISTSASISIGSGSSSGSTTLATNSGTALGTVTLSSATCTTNVIGGTVTGSVSGSCSMTSPWIDFTFTTNNASIGVGAKISFSSTVTTNAMTYSQNFYIVCGTASGGGDAGAISGTIPANSTSGSATNLTAFSKGTGSLTIYGTANTNPALNTFTFSGVTNPKTVVVNYP